MERYKVFHLQDDTYKVVLYNRDDYETVVYQGRLSDCEAYIRLSEGGVK